MSASHSDAERLRGQVRGEILAMFAFDAGFQIDVRRAAELLRDGLPERVVRLRRPSPAWFEYATPPLRVMLEGAGMQIAGAQSATAVECLLFDFGAAVITYTIPFAGAPESLVPMARALYDNHDLQADARGRLGVVFQGVREAITKPELADSIEDFVMVCVKEWPDTESPRSLIERHAPVWAQVLQAEIAELDQAEVERTLSGRMSFGAGDLAVIDWNGALLIDREPEDIVAVLRHANVELLEMRLLDARLDALLDRAYDLLHLFGKPGLVPSLHSRRVLSRFAEIQADSALMFEGVNNAIKLLGDQYLARVYRSAASKLDLRQWDENVLRKIATAESIYQKMTDAKATRRMELLEIIIILLILISIVMPFIPGLSGH